MGRGKRLGVATVRLFIAVFIAVFIAAVAGAEPAGNNGFVPITVGDRGGEASVVVESGDHLWKISQTHLDRVLGRRARAEEVAPYWVAVIDANRDRIRSGDPDLIYPGEVITLPQRN